MFVVEPYPSLYIDAPKMICQMAWLFGRLGADGWEEMKGREDR